MQKTLIHLFFWLLFSIPISAQSSLSDIKVTIKTEASLEELITQLEFTTNYSFAYSPQIFEGLPEKININKENEPLDALLQEIFKPKKLELKLIGKRIHITVKQAPPPKRTLNGYIKSAKDGEVLIGATILVKENPMLGTSTNAYGYFSLSLPSGQYTLQVAYLGYQTQAVPLDLQMDKRLDVALSEDATQLVEVLVTDTLNQRIFLDPKMGTHHINTQQLKTLPSIAGEPDVLKMIQLLPGVNSVGEGSSGLYVRGGNIDQNLILLDEAPVYNPNHLLGFFSAFNTDAIRYAELYKSNFPIEYGGRLSSVLDLRMKEGNKERVAVEGGVGLLISRIHVEGPFKKEKSSFMLSARRTYPDLFLLFSSDNGGNKVHFYDINAKANVEINAKNHLYFSTYTGRDIFRFFDQYENEWGNNTATLRWNHLFSNKSFANFSFVYSRYRYFIENFIEGTPTFNWESGVEDLNLKADFTHYFSPKSTLKFGANSILHQFEPGKESEEQLIAVPKSKALESALYLGHHLNLSARLQVDYGLRLNVFQNLGPARVYQFSTSHQLIDSTQFSGFYNTELGLAPRANLRFQLSESSALKLNYGRTWQYQQELRNAVNSFSAFYIWLPSGLNIPPQYADQIGFGFYKNLQNKQYEFSIETYYKWLNNQVDFVDHARLIQNPYLESQLRVGRGRAFGLELYLAKQEGRLTGWLSYTFSRSLRSIPEVNEGREYPAFFDIPHSIKLVLQYDLSKRWSLAANWQYASGRAVNLPTGSYQLGNTIIPIYGDRNSNRLQDFHRLDLSATLKRNPNKPYKNDAYWVFSVLNTYYRKNPLSVDLLPRRDRATGNVPDPTDVIPIKTYIFGLIPSVSYNFKF